MLSVLSIGNRGNLTGYLLLLLLLVFAHQHPYAHINYTPTKHFKNPYHVTNHITNYSLPLQPRILYTSDRSYRQHSRPHSFIIRNRSWFTAIKRSQKQPKGYILSEVDDANPAKIQVLCSIHPHPPSTPGKQVKTSAIIHPSIPIHTTIPAITY